jgi:Domain of unknown function (DUF4124)
MLKITPRLLGLVALSLCTQMGIAGAEIFQWTDARGILHFTDNPYSIPETVRNSSMLIVRNDFHPAGSSSSEPVAPLATSSQAEEAGSDASRLPSHAITYAPTEANIIVVSRNTRVKKNPCVSVHDCRAAFRPDGAKRRYIHTSAPGRDSRRTLRR